MRKASLDILNKQFGMLKPIEVIGSTGNGALWKCVCKCGFEIKVSRANLISGGVTSCGCKKVGPKIKQNSEHCKNIIFQRLKQRCKKYKRDLNISKEELYTLSQMSCFYCGLIGSNSAITKYEELKYNGLDRIDNDGGYTKDNVLPCCKYCNILRSNILTVSETQMVVCYIKKIRKKEKSPWDKK